MNYHRIYAEFIKDRQERAVGLTGYVEKHHIVPRCMGGGDDAANMVRLTPEDHYFAHLLLAKAHGGKNWDAIFAMRHLANDLGSGRRSTIHARIKFGHVRRLLAQHYRDVLSGPDGRLSDKRQYELRHFDGRVAVGNRFELEDSTGVPRQQISAVLRGASKSRFGWYCIAHNPNGLTGGQLISLAKRDNATSTLHHHDGRVWSGTRLEFKAMTGLQMHWQSRSIAGWYRCADEASRHAEFVSAKGRKVAAGRGDNGDISGSNNPNADPRVYPFVVIATGEKLMATKMEIRNRFNIKSSNLCAVFSGRQTQTGGVALAR